MEKQLFMRLRYNKLLFLEKESYSIFKWRAQVKWHFVIQTMLPAQQGPQTVTTIAARRMGSSWLCSLSLTTTTIITPTFGNRSFPLSVKKKTRACCSCRGRGDDAPLSTASAYAVLGVQPHSSASEIKAAFRAKVLTPTSIFYIGI